MEWSTSPSHDLILAGCHDGMVALWKFSANCTSKETRPLLCFSADSVPIRALAWAPVESDNESANLIVTAGHRGVKFWDIRDPFQPLWELHPVQRVIYSLDWLSDPRCVVLSFDDGSLRILSLMKAACDITQQPGFNCYSPLQFAIWSVHVSRVTGMVAYCSADGTVLHFLLTRKEAEKDDARNRFPHYICGSLTEEETGLTVVTPLPSHPFPMKKSDKDGGNTPKIMGKSPSESTKARKRKGQMLNGQTSDNQILALCYGDGLETGHDPEDAIASQKSEETPKSKVSSKVKRKADEAVECTDKDTEKKGQKGECIEGKAGKKIEKYPPKSIAIHKVRWNMNKGSERWLCYGGAAGILRCQQI